MRQCVWHLEVCLSACMVHLILIQHPQSRDGARGGNLAFVRPDNADFEGRPPSDTGGVLLVLEARLAAAATLPCRQRGLQQCGSRMHSFGRSKMPRGGQLALNAPPGLLAARIGDRAKSSMLLPVWPSLRRDQAYAVRSRIRGRQSLTELYRLPGLPVIRCSRRAAWARTSR